MFGPPLCSSPNPGRAKEDNCEPKKSFEAEMETGGVDRHQSGRPAGRNTGRVEILRPSSQAG